MIRLAVTALAVTALGLSACQNKDQQMETRVEEPYTAPDESASTSAYPEDPYADYASSYPPPANRDKPTVRSSSDVRSEPAFRADRRAEAVSDEFLTPTGGQTYTVRKGDTLYALARRFYSNQSKWKDIWNANRTQLSNPDELRVGMELVIP
ncbi:MAG: LysM domain-containing protein [Planctomycetota bacterium]